MATPRSLVNYLAAAVGRIRAAIQINKAAGGVVQDLGVYLKQCETKLIALMSGQQPPESQPGSIEFGLTLYLLDTELDGAAWGLPPTAITPAILAQWNQTLEGPGVVASDGTLVGYGTYEQLDPGWILASVKYIEVATVGLAPAPFGSNPQRVQVPGNQTVKVAVVGDWGTGQWHDGSILCPALQVKQQVQALNPDFTIHLGDVYYAGTETGLFGLPGEETENFVNLWPSGSRGTFTLNSNHEMYDGARGYFDKALGSSLFAGQQGTSYFSIESDKWVILGLDSAYYSQSLLFMEGALIDQNQIGFIKSIPTAGKTVIVMTHHNGISTDGSARLSLWKDVSTALGRDPDFWYWGHVHNGIVYSAQSAASPNTYARCVGHGAIPFGNGYALKNNPAVSYYANTALGNPDPQQQNRVLNGFALITLSASSITEQFYDQLGNSPWSQVTPL